MYRKYRQLFGNDDADDLCWFAASTTMTRSRALTWSIRALAADKAKAGAEYVNIWRDDLADFAPLDVIEADTDKGVYERPPQPDISYKAFCDAAGGTGSDSFTLAIAHRLPDRTVVLDLVRERKPRFIPAAVVAEFAQILKCYRIAEVQGDGYAGGFHSDEWRKPNRLQTLRAHHERKLPSHAADVVERPLSFDRQRDTAQPARRLGAPRHRRQGDRDACSGRLRA